MSYRISIEISDSPAVVTWAVYHNGEQLDFHGAPNIDEAFESAKFEIVSHKFRSTPQ